MTAIACVGEERRAPLDFVVETIDRQLRLLMASDLRRLVIAYEPAWAIGVGARAAPAGWVGRVHSPIHAASASAMPEGATVPVIYGGSVDPASARTILGQPGVDGLFVGRQALDPLVFATGARGRKPPARRGVRAGRPPRFSGAVP